MFKEGFLHNLSATYTLFNADLEKNPATQKNNADPDPKPVVLCSISFVGCPRKLSCQFLTFLTSSFASSSYRSTGARKNMGSSEIHLGRKKGKTFTVRFLELK
jgi:hypothetical protein